MVSTSINYELYLVTDSTPAILGSKNLVDVVAEAIKGGVTIVQLRDKTSDTGDLVRTAKALHRVTKAAGVPLVINDRVDVALAAGVEGVHIGQDDMDLATARRLLGPDAIIGVTASSIQEAVQATEGGADYLGIGTVFSTSTKQNVKSIIGTAGVREILSALTESSNPQIKTVCIGGISSNNVQRTLYQSASPSKSLDGVAVVSAIIASDDPQRAASNLKTLIREPPPFAHPNSSTTTPLSTLLPNIPALLRRLASTKPLCHNMTNQVVQNLAANVALAVGGSPIMSNTGAEAADLARLGGSLVVNMGTATPDSRAQHLAACAAYNAAGGPVLLDPVGAGATAMRRDAVRALLAGAYFDVIKGNEGEIRQVSGAAGVTQHGVDSGSAALELEERVALVKEVAARERCVVLMTGVVDVVSDGTRTFAVENGHALLGEITGSGCCLGTTIAAFVAVGKKDDKLGAVLAGILMYEIAGERAAARTDVMGPGTFVPAFIDELYRLRQESVAGSDDWIKAAKVKSV